MNYGCQVIKFITPQKYILDGLWLGPVKADSAFIFLHGLTSNVFSCLDLLWPLVGRQTAVITFNNRGHDIIARLRRENPLNKKSYDADRGGTAYEVFGDSPDDIAGALNYVRRQKVKNVYLIGHSTGCQKIVYYLNKSTSPNVLRAAVLLAPMSDYAGVRKNKNLKKAIVSARRLVQHGKKHELLPPTVWSEVLDAQRFLSLYTPESTEEIFSYAVLEKEPRLLKNVKIPLLIVLPSNDEHRDRPMKKIAAWFKANTDAKKTRLALVKGARHSFKGKEKYVASLIRKWQRETITHPIPPLN